MYKASNDAYSTLTSALDALVNDVTLNIQAGDASKFPTINQGGIGSDYTLLVLVKPTKEKEIIKVTRHDSGSAQFTIERGQEGTAIQAWPIGSFVGLRMTAGIINETYTHPSQGTGAHAASAIAFTPAGSLAGENVQQAIEELEQEKAPLSHTHNSMQVGLTAPVLGETTVQEALEALEADKASVNGETFTNATLASPSFTGTLATSINEKKGADVASAATLDLSVATGNFVTVTGTTTITAITMPSGSERTVKFADKLTLTNGANLKLPGNESMSTSAGDIAIFRADGAVVHCVSYTKTGFSEINDFDNIFKNAAWSIGDNGFDGWANAPSVSGSIVRETDQAGYFLTNRVRVTSTIVTDGGGTSRTRFRARPGRVHQISFTIGAPQNGVPIDIYVKWFRKDGTAIHSTGTQTSSDVPLFQRTANQNFMPSGTEVICIKRVTAPSDAHWCDFVFGIPTAPVAPIGSFYIANLHGCYGERVLGITQLITASNTAPQIIGDIDAVAVGGGGGGGGVNGGSGTNGESHTGGLGGSGAVAQSRVSLTGLESVTVGLGGAGGSCNRQTGTVSPGSNGGQTSIGSTIIAPGGLGAQGGLISYAHNNETNTTSYIRQGGGNGSTPSATIVSIDSAYQARLFRSLYSIITNQSEYVGGVFAGRGGGYGRTSHPLDNSTASGGAGGSAGNSGGNGAYRDWGNGYVQIAGGGGAAGCIFLSA